MEEDEGLKLRNTKKIGFIALTVLKFVFVMGCIITLSLDADKCGNPLFTLYDVLITYAVFLFIDASGSIPFILKLNKEEFSRPWIIKFVIYMGLFLFVYFVLAVYIIGTYF
jgi:hypothetical protein